MNESLVVKLCDRGWTKTLKSSSFKFVNRCPKCKKYKITEQKSQGQLSARTLSCEDFLISNENSIGRIHSAHSTNAFENDGPAKRHYEVLGMMQHRKMHIMSFNRSFIFCLFFQEKCWYFFPCLDMVLICISCLETGFHYRSPAVEIYLYFSWRRNI